MSQVQSEISHISQISQTNTFESVVYHTGWGPYSIFVLFIFFLSEISYALSLLSLPFAIPTSICDLNWDYSTLLILHTILQLGRGFGGVILCIACDVYGRKRIMSFGLIIIFLAIFSIAFSHTFLTAIVMSLILGAGVEATRISVKVHLAELLATKRRGLFLTLLDVGWSIGYILTELFAVFMRESANHRLVDMHLTSWRIIMALSGGFNLVIACSLALIEESPRFMLLYKKNHLALLILKQFYTINKSSYSENFDVTTSADLIRKLQELKRPHLITIKVQERHLVDLIKDYDIKFPTRGDFLEHCANFVVRSLKSIQLAFGRRFCGINFILILLNIATIFNFHEMNLLLTHAIQLPLNQSAASSITGIKLFYFDLPEIGHCISKADPEFYKNFLYLSGNILLGPLVLMMLVDLLGRRIPLLVGLVISGLCFATLHTSTEFNTNFALCSLILFFYSMVKSCITTRNLESFPTVIRASSLGIPNFFSISLSIFLIRFLDMKMSVLLSTIGYLLMSAGVLSYFLTDSINEPMVE